MRLSPVLDAAGKNRTPNPCPRGRAQSAPVALPGSACPGRASLDLSCRCCRFLSLSRKGSKRTVGDLSELAPKRPDVDWQVQFAIVRLHILAQGLNGPAHQL